jgi:hypothetical protein
VQGRVAKDALTCPHCCAFNAGGPTYSLDKAALKRLAAVIH